MSLMIGRLLIVSPVLRNAESWQDRVNLFRVKTSQHTLLTPGKYEGGRGSERLRYCNVRKKSSRVGGRRVETTEKSWSKEVPTSVANMHQRREINDIILVESRIPRKLTVCLCIIRSSLKAAADA